MLCGAKRNNIFSNLGKKVNSCTVHCFYNCKVNYLCYLKFLPFSVERVNLTFDFILDIPSVCQYLCSLKVDITAMLY